MQHSRSQLKKLPLHRNQNHCLFKHIRRVNYIITLNGTLPQEPEPTPTSPDSAPDDMVYVPGFGWLESQGPNHCEYAADMYENGNKIGNMG